ncbi:MAG: hypothetical protein ACP5VQ_03465 [Phycisphaerae bacterium]
MVIQSKPQGLGHGKYITVFGVLVFLGMIAMTQSAPKAQARIIGPHQLAPLWIDDLDGFQIRPPPNCEVLQRKFQPPPHSPGVFPVRPGDLVTFVNNVLRWGIIIHLSELQKDVSLQTLLDETVSEARHNYQNVQVLERRIVTNSGRPAGILVLHFTTISNRKPVPLMRQQLIVRAAPKLYYLLTFFSPGDQANGARECFSAMIKTFRLLNIAKIQQQRAAAIIAGRKWIKNITAERLLKKDIHPQLYQVKVNGHGLGYVLLSCYAGTQDGYKGVFCTTNARSFLPNGEVVFSKVICFQAFARQGTTPGPATDYSTWDKAVQTLVPINNPQLVKMRQERIVIDPKTNKPKLEHIHIPYPNMEIHWVRETGDEQSAYVPALDKHGRPTDLFVRHRWMTVYMQRRHVLPGQPNKPTHFNVPSYMPAYLPLTLKYFWPRLVNLSKPATMAFVTYNSSTRRLGLRILRVRGRHLMVVDGKSLAVYHLTAQLNPGIANLWVDAHGKLVKYQGVDGGVWTPTTYAAMDRKWKARLAALKQ